MYLIVSRSFPPELGGMQSLMWGLSRELSKNFMIKVFADHIEGHKEFDEQASFSIERVGGIKLLRKYRKAQLINEFIKENKIEGIIADHWKSLELIKTSKKKYCLIHSKEINHPKGSSQNKRVIDVLNNVEKVIANSEYTKNLAIENGVNENKIIVINPGIDPVKKIDNSKSDIALVNNIDTSEISVLSLPEVHVNNDTALCIGDIMDLKVSGANDYVWLSNEINGSNDSIITISPDTSSSYSVRANGINGCFILDSIRVSVNILPQIRIMSDTLICEGSDAYLWATGGVDYIWSPDIYLNQTTGREILSTPENNITYK